jgi:hypothetical protein
VNSKNVPKVYLEQFEHMTATFGTVFVFISDNVCFLIPPNQPTL